MITLKTAKNAIALNLERSTFSDARENNPIPSKKDTVKKQDTFKIQTGSVVLATCTLYIDELCKTIPETRSPLQSGIMKVSLLIKFTR